MKPTRCKTWAVLALALANGFFAAAQSNGVPGPADYTRFSSFITERNIFDPNRYARTGQPYVRRRSRPSPSAPEFTLVGTMSYDKGMFAFFDGNQSDLRKVLYPSDTNGIAGYVVAGITSTSVTLRAGDKKATVQMKIGEMMRQEGNNWQLAENGQLSSDPGAGDSAAPAAEDSSPDTSAAPSPALEGNDILKKLMQQREQELK